MYSDANGGNPDATSPTLRSYHTILWSKPLPCGERFDLRDDKPGSYLLHSSALGDFSLGSYAISHSYRNHSRKKWLTEQVLQQVFKLCDCGSTIGAYVMFPNNRVGGKHTINQARGMLRLIDDRFDLTLECIRRFYINETCPLAETLATYTSFFEMFRNFNECVEFFLLHDLVNEHGHIKFYVPFDDVQSPPEFKDVDESLVY